MSEPVQPSQLRVSDADRALVETRLRRAVEVGQLELREFDERARLTWAARTRGDLDAVTGDLGELPPPAPSPAVAHDQGRRPVFSETGGGTAMRVLSTIWACVFVLNVVTWGAVSLGTADLQFPWPLFLLPSGAVLLTLYVIGIGRPRR